jgi:hypothetical protein
VLRRENGSLTDADASSGLVGNAGEESAALSGDTGLPMRLLGPYPNPAFARVVIPYSAGHAGRARLTVHDVSARPASGRTMLVRSLQVNGDLLVSENRLTEALQSFRNACDIQEEAVRVEPESVYHGSSLANVLASRGRAAQAVRAMKRVDRRRARPSWRSRWEHSFLASATPKRATSRY